MPSFEGGFADGLGQAFNMRRMRDNQDRLDKMAKLQGQLLELQIQQQGRVQGAQEQIADYFGGAQQEAMLPTAPGAGTGLGSLGEGEAPQTTPDVAGMIADIGIGPLLQSGMLDIASLIKLEKQAMMPELIQQALGATGGGGAAPGGGGPGLGLRPELRRSIKIDPVNGDFDITLSPGGIRTSKDDVWTYVWDAQSGRELYRQPNALVREGKDAQGNTVLKIINPGGASAGGGGGLGAPGQAMPAPAGGGGMVMEPGPRKTVINDEEFGAYLDAEGNPITADAVEAMGGREAITPEVLAQSGYGKPDKATLDDLNALGSAKVLAAELSNLWGQAFRAEEGAQFELPKSSEVGIGEKYIGAVRDRISVITKSNPALALYLDRVVSQAVALARSKGEVGTMTEGDVARAIRQLPNPGVYFNEQGGIMVFSPGQFRDSDEAAQYKLQKLVSDAENKPSIQRWRKRMAKSKSTQGGKRKSTSEATLEELAEELRGYGYEVTF